MAKKSQKISKNEQKAYNPEIFLDAEAEGNPIKMAQAHYKAIADCSPSGGTSMRGNAAYRGMELDKYGALQNYIISPKEAIRLSQVVYWRFGMVRHALDTMSEFTIKDLDFHSDKKISREAMTAWSNGIDLKSFLDQVALEYYRSGNVYIYRFESPIKKSPFVNLNNADISLTSNVKIPVRYTILDPNIIDFVSSGIVNNQNYQVVIPKSEVQAILQHFKQDPQALGALPSEFQEAIKKYSGGKNGVTGDLVIVLKPENLIVLHRKKQPYEPCAMPFLAGIFDDLEFRQELRNMDKAVSRVVARILIHVKVGNDKYMPAPAALDAMRNKLANPSTSTYLVTDGTVEVNQYFPDIGAMLDPKKYAAVNSDIITGLGISPAAYGEAGGNFSSNYLGIKVLLERIIDGRDKIMRQFLIPESLRVAKAFKLKNPFEIHPEIIGVDLTNEVDLKKIYTRLYEVGLLSGQSAFEAVRDNKFPTYDEEIVRQSEFKEFKDDGLFVPILNPGGNSPDAGRPSGTPNPTQTQPVKTSPKGSKATTLRAFSQDEFLQAKQKGVNHIKDKFKLKKLTEEQTKIIESACAEFLIVNEFSENTFKEFLEKLF